MLVQFLLTQIDEKGREWIGGRVYRLPPSIARYYIRKGVALRYDRHPRETKPQWYEVKREQG